MNSLCSCSLEVESTEHYFLRCHNHVAFPTTLMNEFNSVNDKFNTLEPNEPVRAILYRDKNFDNEPVRTILYGDKNFDNDSISRY